MGEDVPLVGEDGGQEALEDPGEASGDDTAGHDDSAGDPRTRLHLSLFLE